MLMSSVIRLNLVFVQCNIDKENKMKINCLSENHISIKLNEVFYPNLQNLSFMILKG